jgi:hypothetical protein
MLVSAGHTSLKGSRAVMMRIANNLGHDVVSISGSNSIFVGHCNCAERECFTAKIFSISAQFDTRLTGPLGLLHRGWQFFAHLPCASTGEQRVPCIEMLLEFKSS